MVICGPLVNDVVVVDVDDDRMNAGVQYGGGLC